MRGHEHLPETYWRADWVWQHSVTIMARGFAITWANTRQEVVQFRLMPMDRVQVQSRVAKTLRLSVWSSEGLPLVG
eukprot:3445312-Amphidinium_carterae.1